jgi:hypothetical protein
MSRRDMLLGSAGLLSPFIARAAVPCPPGSFGVTGGTSTTTTCPATSQNSYTTSFPGTENPISENGRWTNGAMLRTKTSVQTANGNAFGTMSRFDGTNYNDSAACLSGFGPNHEVTATLFNNNAAYGLEAEILLRADITADHIYCYEVDCVYQFHSIYLVRWDMTTGDPNSFGYLRWGSQDEVPLNDGDQFYASIVGTLITCKYKRLGGSWVTMFTYDTAGDSVRYSTGNPGIGFWNETGDSANSNKFGFSDFTANTL